MALFQKHATWAALTGMVLLATACQKEQELQAPPSPPTSPTNPSTGNTAADRVKDTSVLYSRDIYLWYDQIPATFNGRNFAGPEEIMTELRKFSNEPGFTRAVDRWSFAVKQEEWDKVSSGIAGDFGLTVFFMGTGDDLRVRTVEPASPAGRAGVRRGWKVVTINNTAVTRANANAIVSAVYQSTNTTFKFEKPDGAQVTVPLTAAQYQEQPVVLDTTFNTGGKKIGYMVFNSFLGDTTQIYNRFQQTFGRFAAAGVNDVVVDLRYNGGGYVSVQNKLAGYLLPASANGDVLMQQQFNNKYSRYNSTTRVQKNGSLALPRVVFIVSSSTASASELIINNLKPYMEVKLVGPSNTYGKPVGYFNIPVGDWYIFPVSFRSTNKLEQGNYFDGLAVDSRVADGLDKDWGDLDEACLARAVRYLTTGNFGPNIQPRNSRAALPDEHTVQANERLDSRSFKGMIQPGSFDFK